MSAEGAVLTFKYDHNGLRTQKTVQTDWLPEITNYYLHGKLLTHMTVDYTDFDEAAHTDKLHFFYDAQSRPAQVSFNGVIYTYIRNLQGDIVGLLDNSGTLVVEYKYDAWGKPISVIGNLADTLGKRNPFRYRGYVYDEETGLYYLRSRYYNPTVGRFVNADTLLGIQSQVLSHNSFAYTENSPVVCNDEAGYITAYILYDSRENTTGDETGGFVEQAEYYNRLLHLQGYHVVMLGYTNMSDEGTGFIDQWNSMDDNVDLLIIIGHGAPGSIDARGESLSANPNAKCSFSQLNMKRIGFIKLYTCNGATPNKNGTSAAQELSKRTTNKCLVKALFYAKTYWVSNKFLIARADTERREKDSILKIAPFFLIARSK